MAVETPHMNLLHPSQLLANREMIKLNNNHFYNAQMDFSASASASASRANNNNHFYQSTFSDPNSINNMTNLSSQSQPPFLDQNLLNHHLRTQQSEIDRFIAQQTEKMRVELEEQIMRESRTVLSAFQETVVKKVNEKDEEIQRMAKVNYALQEKVKSLTVETQIWRELAQTNEATANSLRSDLEQVLAHVTGGGDHRAAAAEEGDAESSCESNNRGSEEEEEENENDAVGGGNLCRECGAGESVVLLLPCRHLCLCTTCGSTIRNCPLCHSAINASVHVNFS